MVPAETRHSLQLSHRAVCLLQGASLICRPAPKAAARTVCFARGVRGVAFASRDAKSPPVRRRTLRWAANPRPRSPARGRRRAVQPRSHVRSAAALREETNARRLPAASCRCACAYAVGTRCSSRRENAHIDSGSRRARRRRRPHRRRCPVRLPLAGHGRHVPAMGPHGRVMHPGRRASGPASGERSEATGKLSSVPPGHA